MALVVTILAVAACSGSTAPPPVTGLEQPSELGRIWFYRTYSLVGVLRSPEVRLNGVAVGEAKRGTAFFRDVPPGTYEVAVQGDGESLAVAVGPGEQVYVKIRPLFGLGGDAVAVGIMPPERGAETIAELDRGGGRAWGDGDSAAGTVAAAPFHCPAPGTVVVTDTGRLEFTGGDGWRCRFTNAAGETASRYAAFWAGDSRWARERPAEMARLWPLEVGKVVAFTEPVEGDLWHFAYRVVGRETVSVPAGQFEALVVDYTEQRLAEEEPAAVQRLWYAPAIGYFVKSSWLQSPPEDADRSGWQAVTVELPQSAIARSAGS